MTLLQKFLEKIQILRGSNLKYRQPGDGSDGTCDCIGLIIGALRRIGIAWNGIHGSNYAARRETINLQKISNASQLSVGDVVYKAREPGHAKYKLPDRYKSGKAYYNGDLRDYYHVGVVTSVNPLNITHMTSPTVKVDTKLNHNTKSVWNYFGKIKSLVNAGGTTSTPVQTEISTPVKEPLATTGAKAIVTAPSGKYVKMRAQPSQRCTLYDDVLIGAEVTLVEPGEVWAKISYGRRKNWYMMAKYLDVKKEAA